MTIAWRDGRHGQPVVVDTKTAACYRATPDVNSDPENRLLRPVIHLSLALLFLALAACQSGSVGSEPVSRCYPEGSCDEAMFQGGLKGGVANVESGAAIYRMNCASCHGVDGRGLEKTKRHDFTSAIWHASHTDTDIADAVLRGRPPLMPALSLSESQLRDVIGYLRSLKTAQAASDRPSGSGY